MIKAIFMRLLVMIWYMFSMSMPRSWHKTIGSFFGILFLQIPIRKRKIARKNIALCFPEYEKDQIESLLKRNAQMVGMAIFDVAISWFWSSTRIKNRLPYRLEGLELLQQDEKGILLLFKHSLHFMLDARILGIHHDIYGVTRDVKNSGFINRLYMQKRMQACKDIALPHEPLKFVRWLKKGKTVCYALDHDYGMENSIIANFFNVPAATLTAPYKMHKMTGCRICLLDSYYDDSGQLVLRITQQKSLDVDCEQRFLQALNDATTDQISKKPHEYHWYYGRFKSMGVYKDLAQT